jgi:hypothetical protein
VCWPGRPGPHLPITSDTTSHIGTRGRDADCAVLGGLDPSRNRPRSAWCRASGRACRQGDGFAVREAGHSRKGMEHYRRGWNRTVRVSRCSDRVRDHGSEQRFNATVAGLARRGPASHLAGRRDPDSKPLHGSMVGLSFLFRELNVAGQGCACAAAGPRRWVVTGRDFWLACAGPSASTTVGLRRESGVRRSSIEPARQDHQRMCSPARPGGDQDDY